MTEFTHTPRRLRDRLLLWITRDRVLPWITLLMAVAYIVAAGRAASYVNSRNLERLTGGLWVLSITDGQVGPSGPASRTSKPGALPFLSLPLGSGDPASPGEARPAPRPPAPSIEQLKRATGYVEAVTYLWQRSMNLLGGLLAALALLSVLTWRTRLLQLVAAGLILLATAGTLVAMVLLVDPGRGALPALPIRSYVLVAMVQSAYGWILLFAFAKPRPRS